MSMAWDRLLDSTRVRELDGGSGSKADHRTPYQQDYDRVVFSSPVRRLQDKAQVFPLEPNDAVRTRLTHSLEVSNVTRGIALKVADVFGKKEKEHPFAVRKHDICDVAATAGLVHDLGNPPFGHFGEDAIREWFTEGPGASALKALNSNEQMKADIAVYEGNARTIRLLCSLQVLADRYGLNLTAATLVASMKYVAPSHDLTDSTVDHTRSKPGYCWWEQPVVDKARDKTGIGTARHPIAFIVEAADDAVYSLCDLEDAVRKGILSWDELCNVLCDQCKDDHTKKELRDWLNLLSKSIDERFSKAGLNPGLRARDEARAIWFRTQGHGVIVDEAANAFVERYEEIMSGTFKGELVADARHAPKAARLIHCCKEAAREHVYPVRPNLELELRGRRVIHDLMDLLWMGIEKYDGKSPKAKNSGGKAWKLLSENYRALFEAEWAKSEVIANARKVDVCLLRQYLRLLLLTDYIGGMTDTFACTMHRSVGNG